MEDKVCPQGARPWGRRGAGRVPLGGVYVLAMQGSTPRRHRSGYQMMADRAMNNLRPEKKLAVIAALVEGSSIHSVERMTGVHRDTIMSLAEAEGPRRKEAS